VSKAKQKGSQWERDVVAFLNENGYPEAERRYGAGLREDKGDIRGFPVTLECKNHASINLAEFLEEALLEAQHAGTEFGAAVIKRRRKGTKDAYVVMSLEQFVALVKGKQ
jgi:Holliday junction resolvase